MLSEKCKSIFLFLTIHIYMCVCAQTDPQFTQYMYNRFLINPAYAGSEDGLDVSLIYRNQYTGLASRAISTAGFNINLPISSARSGVGITAVNDMIGLQRSTYVALNYDYRKKFKWGKMGIGIGVGFVQTSLDGSLIRTPEGDYHSANHNDNILPPTMQQGIAPDLSFGIYFNNEKYFAGASINHIAFSSAKINSPIGKTNLIYSRNLAFAGGYDFTLSQKLRLMPSAIVKTDLKKVQADVVLSFTVINNILTGISFRGYTKNMIDALSLFLGFRYKGFQLVYSYDASVSYLSKFNTGSHEVSVNYKYIFKKKESKGYYYHNPRYNIY